MASYAKTWSGDPLVFLARAQEVDDTARRGLLQHMWIDRLLNTPIPVEFSPTIEATIDVGEMAREEIAMMKMRNKGG